MLYIERWTSFKAWIHLYVYLLATSAERNILSNIFPRNYSILLASYMHPIHSHRFINCELCPSDVSLKFKFNTMSGILRGLITNAWCVCFHLVPTFGVALWSALPAKKLNSLQYFTVEFVSFKHILNTLLIPLWRLKRWQTCIKLQQCC